MPNWYCTLPLLKMISGIDATDTRSDAILKIIIEEQSRYIDRSAGTHFYVRRAERIFTAQAADVLRLPYFVRVVSLKSDDGTGTFATTWATTDYLTQPNEAAYLSPPWPYDRLSVTLNGLYGFPGGTVDGVKITADWGFYEVLESLTTLPTGGLADEAGPSTLTTTSSVYEVGQTLKIEDEQLFVSDVVPPVSPATDYTVTLERGVNGTDPAAHLAGVTVSLYTYPIIDEACRLQSHRAWRYQKALGMGASPQDGTPIPIRGLDPRAEELIGMFKIPGGLAVRP